MNKNIKKILTSTIISAVTLTAIGCNSNNSKLACESANKTHQKTHCSIQAANALSNEKIGKIVETATIESSNVRFNQNQISTTSLTENNSNVYTLTDTPYISISNENGGYGFIFHATFSINQPSAYMNESVSCDSLSMKKTILKLYLNELYSGNIMLDDSCRTELNNHINSLKTSPETHSVSLSESTTTQNQTSVYDSIITILENNLLPNSPYFSNKISSVCDKIESNNYEATLSAQDKEIADNIASLLNLKTQSTQIGSTNQKTISNEQNPTVEQNIRSLNLNQNNNSRMLNNLSNTNNNVSNGSTTENQNENNQTNNSAVNNRHSRRIRNTRNGNMSTNSSLRNSNSNSPVSRNNYSTNSNVNEGTKIMRADRNQDTTQKEEYEQTRTSNTSTERAQRMPYTQTTTFNQ